MCAFSLYFVKKKDIHYLYMKCFMKRIKSLLDILLHQEHMILEGGGLQLPKIGGGQTQREHSGGML